MWIYICASDKLMNNTISFADRGRKLIQRLKQLSSPALIGAMFLLLISFVISHPVRAGSYYYGMYCSGHWVNYSHGKKCIEAGSQRRKSGVRMSEVSCCVKWRRKACKTGRFRGQKFSKAVRRSFCETANAAKCRQAVGMGYAFCSFQ
jgi:hypothetical protein